MRRTDCGKRIHGVDPDGRMGRLADGRIGVALIVAVASPFVHLSAQTSHRRQPHRPSDHRTVIIETATFSTGTTRRPTGSRTWRTAARADPQWDGAPDWLLQGARFDSARLAESERALRSLGVFGRCASYLSL